MQIIYIYTSALNFSFHVGKNNNNNINNKEMKEDLGKT